MEYSDAHRAFLQILLRYRVLTGKQVKSTFEKICNHFNAHSTNLQEFVNVINSELEELHMAIRKAIQEEEIDDVNCYVIINTLNNESTRLSSSFSKAELGYLKKLVEVLISTDNGAISETYALNIGTNEAKRLGPVLAENLIDKLVEEKWLLRVKGCVSLGALTVCELQTYISQNFQDECSKCFFCKGFTLKGHRCPECNERGHRSCLQNYWNERRQSPGCPNRQCGVEWDGVELVPNKRNRRMTTESHE